VLKVGGHSEASSAARPLVPANIDKPSTSQSACVKSIACTTSGSSLNRLGNLRIFGFDDLRQLQRRLKSNSYEAGFACSSSVYPDFLQMLASRVLLNASLSS
jgi:hypothetical protein